MAKGAYIGIETTIAIEVKKLSEIAEGSIVKVNENGSPAEFFVAKHNYESGLNGLGRTLLVRKYCYENRVWGSKNTYSSSSLNTWFNGTYLGLLDAAIQEAVGTTKFYYTKGNGDKTVATLSRAVFTLSLAEYGASDSHANAEGSALPITSIIWTEDNVWTRTPYDIVTSMFKAFYVSESSGHQVGSYKTSESHGARPCFTLPADLKVDDDGFISGVAAGDITETRYLARKIKKGYIGVDSETRVLPSGYTQIKFISANGKQHINTGYNPKSTTRVVLCATINSGDGSDRCLFGARNTINSSEFTLWIKGQSTTSITSKYGADSVTAEFTSGLLGRHVFDKNRDKLYIDSRLVIDNADSTFSTSYPLYLFENNNAGYQSALQCDGYIHYCRIYEDDVLVRDLVPCKNSSGVAGLYDLVNGVFYQSSGTEAFGGSGNHTELGVARKIKKAYIGIGGVARPCWSGGELAYYGTINGISTGRRYLGAATVGDYALFGGGSGNKTYTTVDAVNKSLVRSTPIAFTTGRYHYGSATVGNYALFGAGSVVTAGSYNTVEVYDQQLTKSMAPSNLKLQGDKLCGLSFNNYAMFAGGYNTAQEKSFAYVDAYDASLTKTSPANKSVSSHNLAATTVGGYALFAGGSYGTGSTVYSNVDAYDASLTKTTAPNLSVARRSFSGTSVGGYALFAAGVNKGNAGSNQSIVDVYDSSLTKMTDLSLSSATCLPMAVTFDRYALFGGGEFRKTVDVFDESLTRTTAEDMHMVRSDGAATIVGDYILFGGGGTNVYSSTEGYTVLVDAYTVA